MAETLVVDGKLDWIRHYRDMNRIHELAMNQQRVQECDDVRVSRDHEYLSSSSLVWCVNVQISIRMSIARAMSPATPTAEPDGGILKRSALRFVLAIGVTSAFSDMTHEGARSITGPFMGSLGASGSIVSTVSGAGELLGYALRYAFGLAADRSQRYWTVTFIGYILQMGVVPFIAIAQSWQVAAVFIVLERVGRAVRTPARDAMTAHAAARLGGGWSFGVREALDAGGAFIGPLLVTGNALLTDNDSRKAFALLAIPAALTLVSLIFTWRFFPNPSSLDIGFANSDNRKQRYPPSFWLYLLGMSLIAIGYADWPLIALHIATKQIARPSLLPSIYAVGMGAEAIASLILGKLYDRFGLSIVIILTFITASYGPLVLLTNDVGTILLGTAFWGFGMAAQESIVKAVLTSFVPPRGRAAAFGLFDSCFGLAWFGGSVILGLLYDKSLDHAAWFTLALQLGAIPLLILTRWRMEKERLLKLASELDESSRLLEE